MLVDLESGKIIELLEGQKKDDVKALFKKIKNPEIIEVVCMDMASHFALSVRESLPADVVIIFDKWHVQRQALDAVAKARIYTQRYIKQTAGNDKARLLSAEDITIRMQKHRSLFLRRRHHAFAPGLEKLLHAYLEQYNGLSVAYNLKERFCEIWGSQNAKVAEARMDLWLNELEEEGRIYAEIYADAVANVKSGERLFYCDTDPLDLFRLVKRTITENRKYVLNYFEVDDRWTNAKSEAASGNIKTVQRLGRGYSFKKLRDRVIGRIPEISNRKKHPGKANVKLKPVSKDWFSELRPAPTRHIDSFFGNSTVRCESPGCRKRVNFRV